MKRFGYPLVLAALLVGLFAYRAWATVTFSGTVVTTFTGVNTLSGNESGQSTFTAQYSHNLSTGATAPDIVAGGGYQGTFTAVTGGTLINLANATNIVISGGTGTIAPAQGYTISGSKKLRCLYMENTDATNTVDVTIPATNGLAGCGWGYTMGAANEVCKLQPYGTATFTFPSGSSTLTAGSNDGLTFTSGAGSPSIKILAVFG